MGIKAWLKKRKHKAHVLALIGSGALYFIAKWQLDLQVAPNEWIHQYNREILPFWFMPNTWSYVMWFGLDFFAFLIVNLIWYLWED